MTRSTRLPTWMVAALAGSVWLGLAACSSDADDPTGPSSPGTVTVQTVPAEGVPLEPGSNLPPTGTDQGELPDTSNLGAGTG